MEENSLFLKLLDKPSIRLGGKWEELPQKKELWLVYHLVYKGDWVDRIEIASLLWPDKTDSEARRNLRQMISKIKEISWFEGVFETEYHRLRCLVDTDIKELKKAIKSRSYKEAADLVGSGMFLEGVDRNKGVDIEEWNKDISEKIQEARKKCLLKYAQELLNKEKYILANEEIDALLEKYPLDELVLKVSMLSAQKGGIRQKGLDAYKAYRKFLIHDMNCEPIQELREINEAMKTENTETITRHFDRLIKDLEVIEPKL